MAVTQGGLPIESITGAGKRWSRTENGWERNRNKQKIVLAGKTLGRPQKYWYKRLREQLSVGRSPGSDG
ncbi:UNVERIFIED_CONTAM: hypothetical protein FKN15_067213 [Acipenser sinensis]